MKQSIDYLSSQTKRNLDIVGGSALSIALLPAAVVVGACVSVDTHDVNPFFVQTRVGRGEEPFAALKFRTIAKAAMSTSTHGAFDSRASRWGQLLRQSGVDELPQLYNVLQGTMSLVGVRPMIMEDIDYMQRVAPGLFDEWYAYYQATKPGLAGPSQVFRHHFRDGKSPEIYRQSAELDLRYFDTASLATDLRILATTPIDMLRSNIGVVENFGAANPPN